MSSSIWFDWASSEFEAALQTPPTRRRTRRLSHPPRLPNQTESPLLPLLIHPVNPFIKSINHDLAFNASFFCEKRCISEYIKKLRFSERPGMSGGGDNYVFIFTSFFWDFHSFCLCIAVNLHKSHCVQVSYQGGFNLFHKRFCCDSEQSEP
ncbi:BnaA04g16300D [Brassica napus]|uniref:(rape) hypothetical protein n=1 Tax=Brassica napus TaxID=3708 RepID=A0A078H125_BRANA|nr:unnamed protein product [Brassica napus]CDY30503.1 BnaA04g16300D [Brassica napus]